MGSDPLIHIFYAVRIVVQCNEKAPFCVKTDYFCTQIKS